VYKARDYPAYLFVFVLLPTWASSLIRPSCPGPRSTAEDGQAPSLVEVSKVHINLYQILFCVSPSIRACGCDGRPAQPMLQICRVAQPASRMPLIKKCAALAFLSAICSPQPCTISISVHDIRQIVLICLISVHRMCYPSCNSNKVASMKLRLACMPASSFTFLQALSRLIFSATNLMFACMKRPQRRLILMSVGDTSSFLSS
jgi:hypothetical protein